MNPFKLIKDSEPSGEFDPSLISKAKDELMKEIAASERYNDEPEQESIFEGGGGRQNRSHGPFALVAGVIAIVMIGGVALLGFRGGNTSDVASVPEQTTGEDQAEEAAPEVQDTAVTDLSSQSISLNVDSLSVEVDGDRAYSPQSGSFTAQSPLDQISLVAGYGDSENSLEMEWLDVNSAGQQVEMRVFFYLAADANDWWVREIRTYSGEVSGEWLYAEGEFFKTPLGQPFEGDLDVEVVGPGQSGEDKTGTLKIVGATMSLLEASDICEGLAGSSLLLSAGPQAITVPVSPSVSYYFDVALVDAQACELANMADYDVIVDDDGALVSSSTTDGSTEPGAYSYSLQTLRAARSTVGFRAISTSSGEEIASAELSVIGEISAQFGAECEAAWAAGESTFITDAYAASGDPFEFSPSLDAEISYGADILLWDTERCELLEVADFEIEVTVSDDKSQIVPATNEGPAHPFMYVYGFQPLKTGATTVDVVVRSDGEIVAQTTMPITIID